VNSWFWNHIRVSRTTNQQYFAKSQKIMTNAQSAEEKEMDDVADLQLSDDEYEILQHKNLFLDEIKKELEESNSNTHLLSEEKYKDIGLKKIPMAGVLTL